LKPGVFRRFFQSQRCVENHWFLSPITLGTDR
jgi:hypothetical protein